MERVLDGTGKYSDVIYKQLKTNWDLDEKLLRSLMGSISGNFRKTSGLEHEQRMKA